MKNGPYRIWVINMSPEVKLLLFSLLSKTIRISSQVTVAMYYSNNL